MTPETCPNCGADVPARAKACPECGSDEKTGWSEQAASDHLGLPDEEFNYGEYVKREFGAKKSGNLLFRWYWWLVALGLLLAFLVPFILR